MLVVFVAAGLNKHAQKRQRMKKISLVEERALVLWATPVGLLRGMSMSMSRARSTNTKTRPHASRIRTEATYPELLDVLFHSSCIYFGILRGSVQRVTAVVTSGRLPKDRIPMYRRACWPPKVNCLLGRVCSICWWAYIPGG